MDLHAMDEAEDFSFTSNLPKSSFTTDESENKDFTKNHPIGRILLELTARNNELYKKLNLATPSDDLTNVCNNFKEGMQIERDVFNIKINNQSNEIESKLLNKELDSYDTANILPPAKFSPDPVLGSASKLAEVYRLFPLRANQKFNGQNSNPMNIVEFLENLNSAQAAVNLSEDEFKTYLLRCLTGRPYQIVSEYINFGHGLKEIYHSLLIIFDTRISPAQAKNRLLQYRIPKTSNLKKAESYIMHLCSRISSQLPPGESRKSLYDLEACNALIRALPYASSTQASNIHNSISAKLNRAPTFVEFTRALTKYEETISQDIRKFGATESKLTESLKANAINFAKKKEFPRSNKKFDKQLPTSGKRPYPYKYGNKPQNVKKSYDGKDKQKKYCSLCGRTGSHVAADGCFKMKNDKGERVTVIPTLHPCSMCETAANKQLFHPEKYCFRRQKKTQTD